MWFSASLLAATALVRLTLWNLPGHHQHGFTPARALTVATGLLAAGYALQAHPLDEWVDAVGAGHLSDLLYTLAGMFASALFGSIPLRAPEHERWRRPWKVFTVAMMAVVVAASRGGAKQLAATELYQSAFAAVTVAAGTLIVVTTVRGLPEARALVALTLAALAGLVSAGVTVYSLIAAPGWMVEHYEVLLVSTAVPVAVGVSAAGLYGVWLAVRRARAGG